MQMMYISKKLASIPSAKRRMWSVTAVFAESSQDAYPINMLRNLALDKVTSAFAFLADVDFVPAPNLQAEA